MSISRRSGGRLFFRCSLHANYPGRQCHSNLIRESFVIGEIEAAIKLQLRRKGQIVVATALEHIRPGRASYEQELATIRARKEEIKEKQYRLVVLSEDGVTDAEATRRRTTELARQLKILSDAEENIAKQLRILPDLSEVRQRLEKLATYDDLREGPLEETRKDMLRAGVKVYVENRQIIKINFGDLS